eukprot:scaffold40305_cov66-Phaeocystis_antarctica.AAC.2
MLRSRFARSTFPRPMHHTLGAHASCSSTPLIVCSRGADARDAGDRSEKEVAHAAASGALARLATVGGAAWRPLVGRGTHIGLILLLRRRRAGRRQRRGRGRGRGQGRGRGRGRGRRAVIHAANYHAIVHGTIRRERHGFATRTRWRSAIVTSGGAALTVGPGRVAGQALEGCGDGSAPFVAVRRASIRQAPLVTAG